MGGSYLRGIQFSHIIEAYSGASMVQVMNIGTALAVFILRSQFIYLASREEIKLEPLASVLWKSRANWKLVSPMLATSILETNRGRKDLSSTRVQQLGY